MDFFTIELIRKDFLFVKNNYVVLSQKDKNLSRKKRRKSENILIENLQNKKSSLSLRHLKNRAAPTEMQVKILIKIS